MISYALANTALTLTELRAQAVQSIDGYAVQVLGHSSPGDGGGGVFIWVLAATNPDNGGTWILPTGHTGTGRWHRVYNGAIYAEWFGAFGTGDDTDAINAAIQAQGSGDVRLGRTHTVSGKFVLKSNVNLIGNPTTITYVAPFADAKFIYGSGVSNVDILGVGFDGLGTWTATPFPNPAGGGDSVGFTNSHIAIHIVNSSNVWISHCPMTGCHQGIIVSGSSAVFIDHNTMTTLGRSGIYLESVTDSYVEDNIITSVLGNITTSGDTDIQNSCAADGVYLYNCQRLMILNNSISDIERIGVVLEGDGVTKNDLVRIAGNSIRNVHDQRGGQTNAGIWNEPTRSTPNNYITGNTIDNSENPTFGGGIITSEIGTIIGNTITGFAAGPAIDAAGDDIDILGNIITGNGVGIFAEGNTAGHCTRITGNIVARNGLTGIWVQEHGNVIVTGNIIEDNGLANIGNVAEHAGVTVPGYYADQKVIIKGNTFLSSANAGDTVGQLHGILGKAGDLNATTDYVSDNTFLFTGTQAAYPANLGVAPCTFATSTALVTVITCHDILNTMGNVNGKIPQVSQI